MSVAEIRPAQTRDDAEIQRLLVQLNADFNGERWHWNEVRRGTNTFVASVDGRVVGFAMASFLDHGPSNYGMIEEVVVDEAFRGRGIGRELIQQCCAWLDSERLQIVFVSTNPRARSLYLREGFRDCTGPWLWRMTQSNEQR